MARFQYVAKDMKGKIKKGTVEAASEKTLPADLLGDGLYLVESKNLTEARGHKRLKPKQLASFCRELSTLLASGVSLVRALDIISGQEGIPAVNGELHSICVNIFQNIILIWNHGEPAGLSGADGGYDPLRRGQR